ncbi:MAG: DUF3320 domain-containing protein [Methanobrevibacter sp.]|uniref:DUF3320 domain-containing protein n=1 Tax=Methanobrevibacter sp. TaxID=66852 RepID=UPI0026DF795E|nr:DUF3320 domain-containing protein [Methanobrevibacter sp.]MDO5849384.1 DUF3320 domain-containing protein [Methanobrevibacter sp.]
MFNRSSNKIEREFENLRNELLDLTLRNQLLNFKLRAKTIAIENQSGANIFQNLILQNKKMYFASNKKEENEDKSRFSIWNHSPIDFSKFTDGDKTLRTNLTPSELQKRLFYINNQAKTMLQEQGYNILYLAVGFLEWKDNKKPQKNLAPLILIPVTMERKKVGKSFELSWTGEEIQTNISLKAKLKEEGIELPDFEFKKYSEVIDHYIREVHEVTRHMKGWDVNSKVALGFFSFTKFVMYNDLNPESWDKDVDLTQKELIQAIFNPEVNNQEAFKEEDIDTQLDYASMYQVLDADSSQIAAIEDVKAGRNLVVEGPPGTGKSQTIVNLIAELLAEGKTVLFVSEKMAALEVVKDRLQSVGLGKFVLELHSHKTRRKKFLKDLQKAATIRAEDQINADQTIRKLESLKKQLDEYPEVIHQKYYGVNLSPFELYGMKEDAEVHFVKKDKILPLVRFDQPELITIKDLDDMVFKLESVAELYQTISNENPWSLCAPESLLPADLREIEILIIDTLQALDNFIYEKQFFHETFGIKSPESLSEFSNSLKAFKMIESKNSSLIDSSIITSQIWKLNNDDPYKLIKDLELYQSQSRILNKFNDNILQADINGLIREIQDLANKKFRLFNSNKKKIENIVGRYYKHGIPDTNQIIRDLNAVKVVIDFKNKIESNKELARQYFGQYWYLGANINDLKAITKWMKEFWLLVGEGVFSNQTIELLSKDLFNINASDNLSNYISLGEDFKDKLSKLNNKLNPRSKLIFKRDVDDVTFDQWKEQLNNWRGQLSSLHLWSQYLSTKNSLTGSYSEPFIDVIEKRNIKKDEIKSLVYGNFADALLNIMFLENQQLATFIGELHDNKINEFKSLDKTILEINRKRIFHKLNKNIPNVFGGAQGSEAQILAGEFTRKSGHLPVRKLLQKAGGLIKQIKPVFMMSPLSIAQYLDPTNEKLQFDVVIFDEASQVKPQDALGAFMRAKTAVVMGDTQQLPPTSFFEQMADGESYEEEATSLDMESILHLCKLSFPVKMLKWHYRSRHESLISVSNTQFYDDELLVYPSPSHNDPELGLKLHYNPDTYYDRGSSSANVGEAKEVVKAIFEHFDTYGDTKSLGVGTFSVAQKNAILEELEFQRKNRPELEPLFAENKEERFFVKNLETIQGDERDVILISVGYGYDNEGKMSLNFGPLNQDGGERRLNVLITRAREKCVVFSNFKAHDMHLTANPPFGVKSLKEFLYYAENLTEGNQMVEPKKEQKFEDSIANFLEENGYIVDRQVGSSGFKVDLALVDENNPGQYFLGITTDGDVYASSKVARDRNRLREQVLEGLGWNIYHLWSTDWYRNRDLGRKKLLNAIASAKQKHAENLQLKEEEAERIRLEAEKRAEELRLAQEEEEKAEKAALEALNAGESFDEGTIIVDSSEVAASDDNSYNEIDENTTVVDDLGNIGMSDDSTQDEGFITINDSEIELEEDNEVFNDDGTVSIKKSSKKSGGLKNSIKSILAFDKSDSDKVINDNIGNEALDEIVVDHDDGLGHVVDEIVVDHDDGLEPVIDVENVKEEFFKEVSNDDDENNKSKSAQSNLNNFNIKFKSNIDDSVMEEVNKDIHDDEFVAHSTYDDDVEEESFNKSHNSSIDFDSIEDDGFDISKGDSSEDVGISLDGDDSDNSFGEDDFDDSFNYDDAGFDSKTVEEEESFNKNNIENDERWNSSFSKSNTSNLDAEEQKSEFKEEKKNKGFFSSIVNNIKEGETKLNVSGNKFYDDNLNEKFIPDVEVNKKPQKQVIKEEPRIIDVPYTSSDSNGNVYDKDDEIKKMATKIVDDVFDSILDNGSHKDSIVFDNVDPSKDYSADDNINFTEDYNDDLKDKFNNDDSFTEFNESYPSKDGDETSSYSYDKYYDENYETGDYFQASQDMKNPLRKNSVYKKEKSGSGVRGSLSNFKNNVSYISKSLKEIEKEDPYEYVNTIDRTAEVENDDSFDFRDNVEFKEDINDNIKVEEQTIKAVDKENGNNEEELVEIIKKEIEEDEYDRVPIHNENKAAEETKIVDYVMAENIGINSSKELYDKSIVEVADVISDIVKVEGPIHVNELIKRVRENCEVKRAGSKFKKTLNDAIEVSEQSGNITKVNDFLFNGLNDNINIRKRNKPNIDLISEAEIEKNIEFILNDEKTVDLSKLAKKASKNFGFKSTSKKTATRINNVLDSMIVNGKVVLKDNIVELNK